MKNRVKLRLMKTEGEEYLWSYNFDDMDFYNYPYSYYLYVPKNNKKLTVRVYFTKYAPNMNLNCYRYEGTPCLYNGEPIILNLCRPFFAKQVIEYVFQHHCNYSDKGEVNIKDGDNILTELGYSEFY